MEPIKSKNRKGNREIRRNMRKYGSTMTPEQQKQMRAFVEAENKKREEQKDFDDNLFGYGGKMKYGHGGMMNFENGGKPDVNELLDALAKGKSGKVARLENKDRRQFNREQNKQFRESMDVYNQLHDAGADSWNEEQADFVNRMDTYLDAIYGDNNANKPQKESTDKQISGKDVLKAGAIIAPIAAGFSMSPLFRRAKMRKDDPNRWRYYSQTSPVHDMGLFERLFPKFSGVEQ